MATVFSMGSPLIKGRSLLRLTPLLAILVAACSLVAPSITPVPPDVVVEPRVCQALPGSATDIAGEPDWRQYGDYRTWTTPAGCLVRIDVISDSHGPAHCGYEAARRITTGVPVGNRFSDSMNDATYVRDPDDVFGDPVTARGFDPEAELPAAAEDTGFRQGTAQLWVDRGDASAIYLVTGEAVERWPLDPQPAGCT